MNHIRFEWDQEKNRRNISKHGITFEDAQSSFHDEYARLLHDPDHSDIEDRFILMGYNSQANLLIVSHCYRENNEVIRIISARKADRQETRQYHTFKG